jgi:NADH-quinone oxidoreductase subunit H
MLAGWASNSKYPQIGGLRSTAQIISYEIAMGLAIVPVIMKTGSLSLSDIIGKQAGWHWNIFDLSNYPQFVGFVIFMCAAFAETNRLPFDLPEGEAELVGGYHTEYSGMKFASFFMAEYANMITASMMMTILFLGGWQLPGFTPDGSWPMVLASAAIFGAKVFAFLFFFIWVRWTLPRFRYDQLMKLGWVYFIPLAMVNLAAAAVWQMFSVQGA